MRLGDFVVKGVGRFVARKAQHHQLVRDDERVADTARRRDATRERGGGDSADHGWSRFGG